MKGYKAFNNDWTCREFQYRVGGVYHMPTDDIQICDRGFHFCEKLIHCFDFYPFWEQTKIAEVEAVGEAITVGNKSVTSGIWIVREIPFEEVPSIVNSGAHCYGRGNVGDHNFGSYNVGRFNVGDHNFGDRNVGYNNSGDNNFGDYNAGNGNKGRRNSGAYNTGVSNTGHCNFGNNNSGWWNRGNCNSGFFNVGDSLSTAFNKPTDVTPIEYQELPGMQALACHFVRNIWVDESDMTSEERDLHTRHKIIGGYLKLLKFETACAMMWYGMPFEIKKTVLMLPNFNTNIFRRITSINVFADDAELKDWFYEFKRRA